MSFFFYERQQRRAFLETRQSLEVKLVLEEESQEQVLNSTFSLLSLSLSLSLSLCLSLNKCNLFERTFDWNDKNNISYVE